MTAGTFAVSRRIWSHPEFAPSAFSEREAFLWLVSEASWKDRAARSGRVVVDLRRGQLCASIRFMGEAWGWSKSRVDRFLKRLENRDMLRTESGTGQLVITLCNYDEYQGQRDTGGTRAGQSSGHERDTSGTNYKKDEIREEGLRRDTNVSLSPSAPKPKRKTRIPPDAVISEKQIQIAKDQGHTEAEARAQFDRFKDGAIANGRAYVDWDAAWRNWFTSQYFKPITYTQSGATYGNSNSTHQPASGGRPGYGSGIDTMLRGFQSAADRRSGGIGGDFGSD